MAVLRTLLARVRLEEDRAARAETRASLMALVEPSSAVPVRGRAFERRDHDVRWDFLLRSTACYIRSLRLSLRSAVCLTARRAN